ncbi:MAG: CDP-diacylglycerol--glycerol-3-phosphate 3-phosphatidyltransferase PgsA, partial [Acidobacteria bacterium]|nr:CDP-diacylglycerol--glycerol-3-phosphate 3-phosphatidyltransferase PgsA [Acidobacteriota bacterium]
NVAAAGCLYAASRQPVLFPAAIALLAVGGLADAFDGIVARLQQKESRYGDFLDHCADRISDSLLVACWAMGSSVRMELTVAATIAVLMNGYVGTQIEATWHQRSYDGVGRGEFVLGMVVYPIASYVIATNGWQGVMPGGFRIAEWLTALLIVFALLGIAQRLALASRMSEHP